MIFKSSKERFVRIVRMYVLSSSRFVPGTPRNTGRIGHRDILWVIIMRLKRPNAFIVSCYDTDLFRLPARQTATDYFHRRFVTREWSPESQPRPFHIRLGDYKTSIAPPSISIFALHSHSSRAETNKSNRSHTADRAVHVGGRS